MQQHKFLVKSIVNNLSQKLSQCNLNNKVNANFTRFVSKQAKREYKKLNQTRFELTPYLRDDLHYCSRNQQQGTDFQKTGIDKLAFDYLKYPDTQVDKKAKSGKECQEYTEVFSNLEQHLYKYKEQFSSRLVYGGLYGAFKSNAASQYCIAYFEEEFFRVKKDIEGLEFVNLTEALSHNRLKTEKQKHEFINRHLKQELIDNFASFRYNATAMQNLLFSFQKMNYFEAEIFDLVLQNIVQNKGVKNIKKQVKIYESLQEIEKSGKCHKSLKSEIQEFKNRLQNKKDSNWLYNVEESRYNTYQEVKQKASQFSEEDLNSQIQGRWLYTQSDRLEKYEENKKNIRRVAEEIENEEKKSHLESLIYEKFMLENLGENNKDEGDEELFNSKIESESSFHTYTKTASQSEYENVNEQEIDDMVNEELREQQKEIQDQQKKDKKQSKKQAKKE